MTKKNLLMTSTITGGITYFYWLGMSWGLFAIDPLMLLLFMSISTISNFLVIDVVEISDLEKPPNILEWVYRGLVLYLWFTILTMNLVYWWFILVYYFAITAYILTRRPDLVIF